MRPAARRRALAAVAIAAAAVVAAAAPRLAWARAEKVVTWEAARVLPVAVRYLRIDAKATIVEKDADAGYVLFDLPDEGKTYRGALELIPVDRGGERPALRLVLRIEDRPEWMEASMLNKLERKLRDELGPEPRIEPKPQPKPEPAPAPAPG